MNEWNPGAPTAGADGNPVVNWQPDGPTCLVFGPRTGRAPLLMLFLGDTLEAHYDPADLDEAARAFIEHVNEMLKP